MTEFICTKCNFEFSTTGCWRYTKCPNCKTYVHLMTKQTYDKYRRDKTAKESRTDKDQ